MYVCTYIQSWTKVCLTRCTISCRDANFSLRTCFAAAGTHGRLFFVVPSARSVCYCNAVKAFSNADQPPTTALQSARRGQSSRPIREPRGCFVLELLRNEEYTWNSGLISFNMYIRYVCGGTSERLECACRNPAGADFPARLNRKRARSTWRCTGGHRVRDTYPNSYQILLSSTVCTYMHMYVC
jgi:hypothetical protein